MIAFRHSNRPSSLVAAHDSMSFWDKHRLSLLLAITVCIAIVLTSVSIALYNNSGAAQLDLSRPGYRSVSSQAEKTDTIDTYSASGAVNTGTIQEFIQLYDKQATKAKAVDAFNGDSLNPEVLEFGNASNE